MNEDIKKFREASETMRKTADLFDKLADVMENETLNEEEKEVIIEETMGRLFIQTLKAQSIFE